MLFSDIALLGKFKLALVAEPRIMNLAQLQSGVGLKDMELAATFKSLNVENLINLNWISKKIDYGVDLIWF